MGKRSELDPLRNCLCVSSPFGPTPVTCAIRHDGLHAAARRLTAVDRRFGEHGAVAAERTAGFAEAIIRDCIAARGNSVSLRVGH